MFVSSTAPATAFTIALFDEHSDGTYLVLNDITYIRYVKDHFETYEANTVKKLILESQNIVWIFKKATESIVADNTIYFGTETPSKIRLMNMS